MLRTLNDWSASNRGRVTGIDAVLQQQSAGSSYARFVEPEAQSLRSIAYRSLAVSTPTDSQMRELLQVARRRNKKEGLSGVLLFDHGTFFQWLEGPSEAIDRVWSSISRDPRHHQVSVLRDQSIHQRVFDGCDLLIARGAEANIDAAVAAISSSSTQLLKHLVARPASLLRMSWKDSFATSVIPRLLKAHAVRRESTRHIWHAERDAGDKLAHALLGPSAGGTARYVDSLLDQGAGLSALYHEVFEPAQLHLGQLWHAEQCNDFNLFVALARLHLEVRRVNAAVGGNPVDRPGHSVLLSLQPGESHGVSLAMTSEMFDRSGWEVTCEFPEADQKLLDLLHGRWFDVLKISQSGSLRRDSRLVSMRDTIDAARLSSLNPALIVMVDGRTFSETPQAYQAVHADAVSTSVLDAVPIAERLFQANRSVLANVQVSAS
jgi:hypothetical protein